MSRGVGGNGQVSEGVSGGDAQMWRGRQKVEQMWRSDQEQRASGNRGVSGHSGQTQRGEKDDWTWRSKQEWTGECKWRDGWKRLGDQRCEWE